MKQILGHVTAAAGSQVTVCLESGMASDGFGRIGNMVKVRCAEHDVIGVVNAARVDPGSPPRDVVVVELFGELVPSHDSRMQFSRGISRYPVSGAPVFGTSDLELAAIFAPPSGTNLRIGSLVHDPARPALLLMDPLLTRHFAVLGSTGSGKSCTATLILSAIAAEHPNAHIVLLDPHNEYATAFGELAEVIDVDNLQMPFWFFDFEEAVRILVRGGTAQEQEAQAIILKNAITRARRHYAGDDPAATSITVDTPVPFRVTDLLRFIDGAMGKLDKADTSAPYLRLRTRLESLRDDRRFSFMFSEMVTRDTLAQFVGRMLRLPANGKPLSIMDLSGLPSEIADVVVSLACRVIFDFVLWSGPGQVPPLLLVCEEAHRYVPADEKAGFAAAARAITRIAKEGRKYGISLGLISQRPSELSRPRCLNAAPFSLFAWEANWTSVSWQRHCRTPRRGCWRLFPHCAIRRPSSPVKVCRCPSECASMSCRLPIGRAARAPSSRGRGSPVANTLPVALKRSSRRECAAGACAPVRARYSKSVGVAAVRRKHRSCAVQSRHAIVTERKKLLREQRRGPARLTSSRNVFKSAFT